MNSKPPGRAAVAVFLVGAMVIGSAGAARQPFIGIECATQGLAGAVTDVNAQAGNGRITIGLNRAGTITTFRYPNPSFYNQVKNFTAGNDANGTPTGALPNEGSFAGIRYVVAGVAHLTWLRQWPHTQRYDDATTPVVVTTYGSPGDLGLTVTDTDLATVPRTDAFVRDFMVQRDAASPATDIELIYYEKFSPIASKLRYLAGGQDDCLIQLDDQQVARYDGSAQAILHSWSGVDASTARPSSVAFAFGWDGAASAHEVGRDGHDPLAPRAGPADAYDQLSSAPFRLGGGNLEVGQATGAIATPLHFDGGVAARRLIIGAGSDDARALASLDAARSDRFASELAAVDADWTAWFHDRPLPATDDARVLEVAERSLVTMRLAVDPDTSAIVASADTQSPYAQDWIRDGAFINEALDVAGLHDLVTRHDLFEAAGQTSPSNPDALRPPGNWPMNLYGDGLPGDPIPYEIDETGFGAWTLWHHATYLSSAAARDYLTQVYPAISRAADWLTVCRDPRNGFPCDANEDDSFTPSQTLHGAGPVLLGLRSAIAAAAEVGDRSPSVATWRARASALQAAIDDAYDPTAGAYRESPSDATANPVLYSDGGWLLWPVQLHSSADARMQNEAAAVWASMQRSLASASGGYEAKALLGVCRTWTDPSPEQHAAMAATLHTIATDLTTPTGLLSEWWQRFADGRIHPRNDAPHVWEHALFYLSAMCIDGVAIS